MDSPINRQTLIGEYLPYRDVFKRAPKPWSTPNAREEAGYCLQFPAPMQIAENLAGGNDVFQIGAYWSHVQAMILTALRRERKGVA